jgi:hypothetical protein
MREARFRRRDGIEFMGILGVDRSGARVKELL